MGRRSDASRPVGANPSSSSPVRPVKTGLPLMKFNLKGLGNLYA